MRLAALLGPVPDAAPVNPLPVIVETSVEGMGTLRNTVRLVPAGPPSTPPPERKEP